MRLIDADAVYEILESCEIKKDTYGSLLNDWDHGYNCGIERAESEIECAPTIDAVPVIRCRECKNAKCIHEDDDWWECSEGHRVMHGEGYCSWAERRDDESD